MNQIEFAVHYGAKTRYACTSCMMGRISALEGIEHVSMREGYVFYYSPEEIVLVRSTDRTGDCPDCVLKECVAPQGADQSAVEQGGVSGH